MLNEELTREMRAGRRFILVVDEAQNLTEDVLESVRLLSNFETPWMKLMQIVLAGQPQLADRLTRPCLAQLRQRISSVIRIEPLSADEVEHLHRSPAMGRGLFRRAALHSRCTPADREAQRRHPAEYQHALLQRDVCRAGPGREASGREDGAAKRRTTWKWSRWCRRGRRRRASSCRQSRRSAGRR